MSTSRTSVTFLCLVGVAFLVSCKGAECVPTDPICNPPPPPPPAGPSAIAVISPIDVVMASGRTALMSAVATDVDGDTVGAMFTWTSTNTATATVSASGLVTAVAAGTTTIRATSGTVSGTLEMRVVDADLDGITATLSDAFVQSLRDALEASTGSALSGFLSACVANLTSGNVLAIDACIDDAQATNGSSVTDDVLLGVLALFLEHARQQLGL